MKKRGGAVKRNNAKTEDDCEWAVLQDKSDQID